ncbi:TrbL/VirB6 plasmid conjugal transfer protein [Actinocorallia herbida]|uniref:TrbL/VirB6 plasmid conjugal transfer protein n=1 Tax=Actinocorallia herbida TaxID=58109 RepID=A0A3N1CNR5_9ACTN|nr:type IV secretion system protein [Actinocorallia herbida]ROO82835.1 TrbL/VirB6 plasmid conjugal transfer protein [Actinocorallia herbida]
MRLRRRGSTRRRSLWLLLCMALFLLATPAANAAPTPPWSTNVNDACAPAASPAPEAYGSGSDGLIKPPDYPNDKLQATAAEQLTYYDRYGTVGQTWYAIDMGCGDAMALMGNSVANTVFTLVRAIDRTTISVYQSAASESLLSWLKDTVDDVITGMGKTFNARYWTPVVILAAITLAWWGLVRKRTSKVAEGTIWMVAAMVGLMWLIARPGDFTTLGTTVSNATSTAFNAALPQSNAGTTCIPTPEGKPAVDQAELDATTRNANGLWVALVCKPWLMGEFGTTDPEAEIVKKHADKLLYAQAVDLPETYGEATPDFGEKADAYKEVAKDIKENYAGVYPVFQGKQWTSRLAVAFGALFAALVAGLLILVISVTLIIVKIAFLLLLVAGPIFLGIGIHPGIGRVIAVRWLELLLSMLLKQAALIGVLALLLWAYGLILGEGLPWGLQIMLLALVTGAAFIYRKPFQHLFAAVGYSAVSRNRSQEELEKSILTVRKNTLSVAQGAAAPGSALSRLVRREGGAPALSIGGEDGASTGGGGGGTLTKPRAGDGGTGRAPDTAPPLNLPTRRGGSVAASGGGPAAGGGAVAAGSGRGRGGTTGAKPPAAKPPAKPVAPRKLATAPKRPEPGTSRPVSWGERGEKARPAAPRQGDVPAPRAPGARPAPPAPAAPRDQAPPLWARRVADNEPPAPFWLKPSEPSDD